MRIGLIGYEANVSQRVGSNQYAFELLRALHRLDEKNEYLVFLSRPPLPDMPQEREGWTYRVVGPAKLWNFFGLPIALFKARKEFDLVFNPGHYAPLFTFKPLLISIMDLGYLRFPGQFTKGTFWKLKYWTSFSLRKAVQIFSISQFTKDDLVKTYQINENKITVAHPGHDEQEFNPQVPLAEVKKVKEKYKLGGDYLLFLSTLKPSKNIEGLIRAFEIFDQKNPGYQLVIAGKKGWLFGRIFALVKELKLENKIVFTDFVDKSDIPGLLKGAACFVLPSFWEGFGIPVVESMAVGVPVVVSNAGSLPEIVGQAGIVIDPDNDEEIVRGIEKALKNKDYLVKKGFEQAKEFDWDKCAKITLKVLEKTYASL